MSNSDFWRYALLIWPPVLFVTAWFVYFTREILRMVIRRNYEAEVPNRRYIDEIVYRTERSAEEYRHIIPSIIQSSMEDMQGRLRRTVEEAIHFANLERLATQAEPTLQALPIAGQALASREKLIREISHTMNTPLSQIEAALLIMQASPSKGGEEIGNRVQAIQSAVDLIKATIIAFRETITSTRSTTTWTPASLAQAVESVMRLYIQASGRSLNFKVDLPVQIGATSNTILISALAPLLENAVDAAQDQSTISVTYTKDGAVESLSVIGSAVKAIPDGDVIYDDGYTTKDGHSGMGLAVARDLISSLPGADLRHSVSGESVTFCLSFTQPS